MALKFAERHLGVQRMSDTPPLTERTAGSGSVDSCNGRVASQVQTQPWHATGCAPRSFSSGRAFVSRRYHRFHFRSSVKGLPVGIEKLACLQGISLCSFVSSVCSRCAVLYCFGRYLHVCLQPSQCFLVPTVAALLSFMTLLSTLRLNGRAGELCEYGL